ncbi:hypothetical protein ABEB36_006570 [Hypothenemus hampei]
MLRFYAYFKQATLGPCTGSRPAFWDVVGRAKYDAWKQLGDMSKSEAMKKYVDELHAIVETMSYSDKVANFLEAPTNELDGINIDDLELVAGDVLERVRSQPNSPLASREGSPIRFISNISSSRSISPTIPSEDSDHSDDEYIDTSEVPVQGIELKPSGDVGSKGPVPHISRARTRSQSNTIDISSEIAKAVENLKVDIERLANQVNTLEAVNKRALTRKRRFFFSMNSGVVAFMVVWPFVASFLTHRLFLRHK